MLQTSKKFGTRLTVGPRLRRLLDAGPGYGLLWAEKFPDQEEATPDGRGEFQRTREWIETANLRDVFDLWCRGNNLVGYAELLLEATSIFRKVVK